MTSAAFRGPWLGWAATAAAATLTQQVAKVLFKTRDDLNDGSLNGPGKLGLLITKTKEWLLAIRLERSYTKREIIRMYLNTVDYGSNAFGVNVAAKTFFNKKPKDLTTAEAATLVGIVNAPSRFSPGGASGPFAPPPQLGVAANGQISLPDPVVS